MRAGMMQGICTNLPTNCEKAANREVQSAPASKFVCDKCGLSLREFIKPRALWKPIAAGVVGLAVLGGAGYFTYATLLSGTGSGGRCPAGTLDEFVRGGPSADQLLQAGRACLADAKTTADAGLVAFAARLCRAAADGGKAEGALCLGQLYDPKDIKPGRIGQMPAADFTVAFDNYRRGGELGSSEAFAKLAELKVYVEAKAQEGNAEARHLLDRWP